MFVRWKAVRGECYAQLEKRCWENGKVKTKVVAYLGKLPFDKLLAMLREGKISVAEVAQINYREKPVGLQNILVYALAMECRGTPWAKVSYLAEIGLSAKS
ncbi:hypothetical protein IT084_17350 [Desulfallas sp. Bu1-1]|uniref:hypothetical protein n=1 Tax=Desulfallas sp. Bu1-1 TaxID=2787620 RepID=UPI00189E4A6C|nr:hypothetical protein [Desulfallas sp. Bu1-1]MBF7084706.1 hypothetical protein [Desulfallas sp. Bu1-1]